MLLFSKRNSELVKKVMSGATRNRLSYVLNHLIFSKKVLEPFLIKEVTTIHLDGETSKKSLLAISILDDITMAEGGYKISEVIPLAEDQIPQFSNIQVENEKFVFDLIELIFIFAKSKVRDQAVTMIQDILREENSKLVINGYLVLLETHSSLRTMKPMLKDTQLQSTLDQLFRMLEESLPNYKLTARSSADLLQRIFSSQSGQSETKQESTNLCDKVAKYWTIAENRKGLSDLLSNQVKLCKEFSNKITDIRHTDQHTIAVNTDVFYKMITYNNLGIVETFISSLPDEFIYHLEPEESKQTYLSRYQIKNEPILMTERDEDDIPF